MGNYNVKKIIFIFLTFLLLSCGGDNPEPYTTTGEASYYAGLFEGRKTASGTLYRQDSLTAAHKTLPFGTVLKVTNLHNNKEVTVEINDRGPYSKKRIIDLSRSAAEKIDMLQDGTAKVKLEVIQAAPGYTISDSTTQKPL